MTRLVSSQYHVSPDGLLRLLVNVERDGDVVIGFDGMASHTHGDILAELSGLDIANAVIGYVEAILGNRAAIALRMRADAIDDAWVEHDFEQAKRSLHPGETITFRYWDGTVIDPRESDGEKR